MATYSVPKPYRPIAFTGILAVLGVCGALSDPICLTAPKRRWWRCRDATSVPVPVVVEEAGSAAIRYQYHTWLHVDTTRTPPPRPHFKYAAERARRVAGNRHHPRTMGDAAGRSHTPRAACTHRHHQRSLVTNQKANNGGGVGRRLRQRAGLRAAGGDASRTTYLSRPLAPRLVQDGSLSRFTGNRGDSARL